MAAILMFMAVVAAVSYHGTSSRKFASSRTEHIISRPEEAYAIWKEKKVKGRTLLLFDNYPHLMGLVGYSGSPQLRSANVIEFSVFGNIIRKIYLVVPDEAWEEFRQQEIMRPIRAVAGFERGLYLYTLSGIPLIAVTPTSLPQLSEELLVYINGTIYNDAKIRELLSLKHISSDIIISLQGQQ